MKNKYLIWIVVLLWITVLSVIIFKHNEITTHGKIVILKTEPVDPRDPFRGDYLNLQYDISTIADPLTEIQKKEVLQSRKIYAVLKKEDYYYVLDHFSTTKPNKNVTYIRGGVWGDLSNMIRVQYNIESYFVPEGKGIELQTHLGKDMFVEVYVDEMGEAAIKTLLIGKEPVKFDTNQ